MNFRTITLISLMAVSAASLAASHSFTATLTGANSVPAVSSLVTGQVTFTYDTVSYAYTLTGSTTGTFTADLTGFHIHRGAAGTNGNVIIDFGVAAFSNIRGGTINKSGTVVGSTVAGTFLSAADKVAYLESGNAYVNTHTVINPGGEIRGQLAPVPEPATMLMLGFGTLSLLRKRKKSV